MATKKPRHPVPALPAKDGPSVNAPEYPAPALVKTNSTDNKRVVYFSFMHPDVVPGGAQLVAKRLHDAHLKQHGPESSLFVAAMVGGGPRRPEGSNIVQLAPREF